MPANRQPPYTDDEIIVMYAWWERNRDKSKDYYANEFQVIAARLFATILQNAPLLRERCEQANGTPEDTSND